MQSNAKPLLRAIARSQLPAWLVTLPIALAWFGYGGWFWYRHASWVEVPAEIERVDWAHDGDDLIAAGCYKFATSRGKPVATCGKWDEGRGSHPGDRRPILYNPEDPTQIVASRTDPLRWPLRITPLVYLTATLFFAWFFFRVDRKAKQLDDGGRTVQASIVAFTDGGYFDTDFARTKMSWVVYRWRDPNSGKHLEFKEREADAVLKERQAGIGDRATIRFVTDDPSKFEILPKPQYRRDRWNSLP